jgi:transcriptional regulator with XRE-family HTH domain
MARRVFADGELSAQRYSVALSELLSARGLSYRQLAYKTGLSAGYLNHLANGTRAAPAEQVLRLIARALHVEPEFFLEHRQRRLTDLLERDVRLADALYAVLVLKLPAWVQLDQALAEAREGAHPERAA